MSRLSDRIRKERCPFVTAVIAAGGTGSRFGGDKLAAVLGGLPVLVRTLLAFETSEMISEIIISAHPDRVPAVTELCRQYRITKAARVAEGGESRLLSSYRGCLAASAKAEIIAVHDAARPLVTEELIRRTVWAAHLHTAAVPAVPVHDTIKQVRGHVIVGTPERDTLFAAQTPQCFQKDILLAALSDAVRTGASVTDDCSAVERIGGQAWLVEGDRENIKITTQQDLLLAEQILAGRKERADE